MKMKLFAAIFGVLLFTISNADAQTVKRSRNQNHRINHGVRSGELTKAEALNLKKDQREIRQDRREALSDGTITKEERKEIKREQRQASRKIFRKKHNNRDRN